MARHGTKYARPYEFDELSELYDTLELTFEQGRDGMEQSSATYALELFEASVGRRPR